MAETILIVDDDPVTRRLLENMVSRFGYQAVVVGGGDAAITLLAGEQAPHIDAVVLDLVMPDLDGMGVLARMREAGVATPVIVQTAHGGIDNVVSAMRAGASDFVVKPVGAERLQVSLRNALTVKALEGALQRVKRSHEGTLTFKDIITRNERMRGMLRAAEKAAASGIPVLIEGESGVGKELVARAIHGSGQRRAKPFVAVNCGAIPENLVESVLFGHEKGAFTGATERHLGKFVEASSGTLFLDEVGELPPPAQIKLLRALQEDQVEPVGARRPAKVDVRIISATNRDLIADVKVGRFREDLFYRLHVFPIAIPPLRERRDDIPDLIRHFLTRFSAEEGKRIHLVSAEALTLLHRHRWPGNVRQLENTIFRAVVLADGDTLDVEEFPQIAAQIQSGERASAAASPAPEPGGFDLREPLRFIAEAPPLKADTPLAADTRGTLPMVKESGDIRALAELEADVIRFAISHYRGRMSEIARRLGIGRSTLYRKLEGLGLVGSDGPGDDPATDS